MSFLAGILMVLVWINCLVLVLLVLMQLPKKDAGAGIAFGGGAADALFGAGSGNFLTQATKYGTFTFFVLALILGHVETRLHAAGTGSEFEKKVQQQQQQVPMTAPATTPSLPQMTTPAAASSNSLLLPPSITPPAAPAKSSTASNAPAAPAQPK